jgi:uncharacterized protein
MNQRIGPITTAERIDLVDVLRGLAVCGILIGNMQWFSGYGMVPATLYDQTFSQADKIVQFLVHFFVEGKFYSIFSFLFGFGFALQISRAEQRGDATPRLFKRRLLWLFVIGALHATLLWAGDILSVYALMGFVLVLFRKKDDKTLIKWVVAMMAVPVLFYILSFILFRAFVPADALASFDASQAERWNEQVRIVTHGSWWQIVSGYNLLYLAGRWAGLIIQMRLPKILAMFLLGLWTYRREILRQPENHRDLLRKVLVYGGILGLIGNIALAAFAGNEAPFPPTVTAIFGVIGYAFGVPALALWIISAVALLWPRPAAQRVLSTLAPIGRMALTNYVLQTIVCLFIFYSYGFAEFGRSGPLSSTLIALGIFAGQILVSTVWLRYFQYGPLEWIWRQLTYGRRLRLRLEVPLEA